MAYWMTPYQLNLRFAQNSPAKPNDLSNFDISGLTFVC